LIKAIRVGSRSVESNRQPTQARRSPGTSAATIVNQQAGNLKLVQRLLGHSNLSTTADVYTHTFSEAEREAALALEQAIYSDLFSNVLKIENKNNNVAPN
jgi:integrase